MFQLNKPLRLISTNSIRIKLAGCFMHVTNITANGRFWRIIAFTLFFARRHNYVTMAVID